MAAFTGRDSGATGGDKRGPIKAGLRPRTRWLLSRERLKDSPSRRQGIDEATETQYTRTACGLVDRLARKCDMGRLVACTAMVFLHRYFTRFSWTDVDCHVIAAACTFLAGKVEERPRKLREVVKEVMAIMAKEDGTKKTTASSAPDEETSRLQEQILRCEKQLLGALDFDFAVTHPFEDFETLRAIAANVSPDLSNNDKLFQTAYSMLNDSMQTSLCILCEPRTTAALVLYLALRYHDISPPANGGATWKDVLKLEDDGNLLAYMELILDLYSEVDSFLALRVKLHEEDQQQKQAAKQSLQAAAAQNARPRPPDCPMPAYPPPPPPLAPEKSALEEGEIEEGEIA